MCSSIISQMIDDLESGGIPKVTFFSGVECGGGHWPLDNSLIDLSAYNTPILASTICPPSLEKLACPVPAVVSMVFGPGMRIQFFGNDTGGVNTTSRVKEIGQTNFYTSDPPYVDTAHIGNLTVNAGILTWNSSECKGEKNGCSNLENCNTPTTSPFDTDGKLLHSMVSCNSQLWPSFAGINTGVYISGTGDTTWSPCLGLPDRPDTIAGGERQDFCVQAGGSSIETTQYATQWGTVDDDQNCSVPKGFFQACSCLGTQDEADNSSVPHVYTNPFIGPADGGCNTTICGKCLKVLIDFSGTHYVNYPCVCSDSAAVIRGSTKHIEIGLVTSNHQSATWEELQTEWCYSGLSVGGISISRYAPGTPSCDNLMRRVCSNVAELTVNPTLDKQCQCVIEEKVLQEQFVGISLPSACFSSLCNINSLDVYKTKQQLTGCDSRLCSQLLSVHGIALLAQGVQEVLCNGIIYDVSRVATNGDVPLVSQVVPSYGSFVVGPVLYLSVAILLMLFVLCVIWIVRRIRNKRRENAITQQEFERSLLSSK